MYLYFVFVQLEKVNPLLILSVRTQAAGAGGKAGAEEEQTQGLLQGARGEQDRHRRRDQEGLQEEGTSPPSR